MGVVQLDDGIVDTLVSALQHPSGSPTVIESQLMGILGNEVAANVEPRMAPVLLLQRR